MWISATIAIETGEAIRKALPELEEIAGKKLTADEIRNTIGTDKLTKAFWRVPVYSITLDGTRDYIRPKCLAEIMPGLYKEAITNLQLGFDFNREKM